MESRRKSWEKLLTIGEAADLLQISPRTIYEMVSARGRARRQHQIPVIKLNGRCLRFREMDLTAWLDRIAEQENP